MAKLRRPENRLVQPRLRGLAGPFFQQIAPAQLIHTPGNFIAATGSDSIVAGVFLTSDPSTHKMTGVVTGVGGLTAGHTSTLYAQQADGYFQAFASGKPLWSRGRYIDQDNVYAEDGGGVALDPKPRLKIQPALTNVVVDPTDYTTANWGRMNSATATKTVAGLTGAANTGCVVTDPGASVSYLRSAIFTSSGAGGKEVIAIWVRKKSTVVPETGAFDLFTGETNTVIFNKTTGAMTGFDVRSTVKQYDVIDCGDSFCFLMGVTNDVADAGTTRIFLYPAYNLNETATPAGAATGSSDILAVNVFHNKSIADIRGCGPCVDTSAKDATSYSLDTANLGTAPMGWSLEWVPWANATEITDNIEIISSTTAADRLYYDPVNRLLTCTDGTNTATVALDAFAGTRYKIGVAYGESTLCVVADGVAGTETPWDGSFTDASLTIGRAPIICMEVGELTSYSAAYADCKAAVVAATSWGTQTLAAVGSVAGARCWFSGPGAIIYNGHTVWNAVDASADHRMAAYNHATGVQTDTLTWNDTQVDDHNDAGFLVRADGRLAAYHTQHNADNFYYQDVVTNVGDPTTWGTHDNIKPELVADLAGAKTFTYAQPHLLADETNDPIYLFLRMDGGSGWTCWYAKTTDNFANLDLTQLLVAGSRPYFQTKSNGTDRIDVICNDAHPLQVLNSTYHCYYTDGAWHKSDGTDITANLPLDPPTEMTRVFDGTTNAGRSWVWDLAYDSEGSPVVLVSVMPTMFDHGYYFGKVNGSGVWSTYKICDAGKTLYPEEPYYSGGICFDHENPFVVYCSREKDGAFNLWRYTSADAGETWVGVQWTFGTTRKFRPEIARGTTDSLLRLTWVEGPYRSFTSFVGCTTKLGALPVPENVTTEGGDQLITESGDSLVTE